jgi:hypothetical protein
MTNTAHIRRTLRLTGAMLVLCIVTIFAPAGVIALAVGARTAFLYAAVAGTLLFLQFLVQLYQEWRRRRLATGGDVEA